MDNREILMRTEEKAVIVNEINKLMSDMDIHQITLLYYLTKNLGNIDVAIRLVRSVVNSWR